MAAEVKQLPPAKREQYIKEMKAHNKSIQPDQKSSQMAATADYTGFSVDDQTKNDVVTDPLASCAQTFRDTHILETASRI